MQVSDQAVRLWQEGWFQMGAEPSGVSTLRNPKVSAPPPWGLSPSMCGALHAWSRSGRSFLCDTKSGVHGQELGLIVASDQELCLES